MLSHAVSTCWASALSVSSHALVVSPFAPGLPLQPKTRSHIASSTPSWEAAENGGVLGGVRAVMAELLCEGGVVCGIAEAGAIGLAGDRGGRGDKGGRARDEGLAGRSARATTCGAGLGGLCIGFSFAACSSAGGGEGGGVAA